jgi:hypothetical protein
MAPKSAVKKAVKATEAPAAAAPAAPAPKKEKKPKTVKKPVAKKSPGPKNAGAWCCALLPSEGLKSQTWLPSSALAAD